MAIGLESSPLTHDEIRAVERRRFDWTGRVAIFIYRLLAIAAFLGIWQLLADTKIVDPFFISSPTRVARLLSHLLSSSTIYSDAWVTLKEAIKGFAYGSVAGIIIGFALGHSRLLTGIFMPLLNLLNTLPRIALAPLFILWFGVGERSKVVLVFSVAIVILIFNTYSGTQTVDRDLVTNANLLGANRRQILLKVTLPWCLPWIFAGLRIALAWSLGAAVVGEYLASRAGLGYRIFYYSGYLNETGVFAGCVILLAISGTLFAILDAVEKRLFRWRPDRR